MTMHCSLFVHWLVTFKTQIVPAISWLMRSLLKVKWWPAVALWCDKGLPVLTVFLWIVPLFVCIYFATVVYMTFCVARHFLSQLFITVGEAVVLLAVTWLWLTFLPFHLSSSVVDRLFQHADTGSRNSVTFKQENWTKQSSCAFCRVKKEL